MLRVGDSDVEAQSLTHLLQHLFRRSMGYKTVKHLRLLRALPRKQKCDLHSLPPAG
jgi:hypothetical protein